MLVLILLFYVLPVYLVFFHFQWVPLTRFWRTALWMPPVVVLIFFWFGIGRYAPIAQDAYLQASVVQVAPEVGGVVVEVLVADNAPVKKGDPLFRIDSKLYQSRLDQAQAKLLEVREQGVGLVTNTFAAAESLRGAEANLDVAGKDVAVAKASLEASRATVSKFKAQLELSEVILARQAKLMARNAASREDYDNAVQTAAVNKAQVAEAEQGENKARNQVEAAIAHLSAARAAIREAKAQRTKAVALVDPPLALERSVVFLEADRKETPADDPRAKELDAELVLFRRYATEARELFPDARGTEFPAARQAREAVNQAAYDLDRTLVKAPCDGVVTNLQLTVGTYAAPGKPVLAFIDTSRWRLVAPVLENGTALTRPGDEVSFTLRNFPCTFRRGKVLHVGRGVIAGQGQPGGTLPDTQPRDTRQFDTPESAQDFQVVVDVADDKPEQPLRVGATGRAVVFNGGGLFGVNQVATILAAIMSLMDFFNPKPSALSILLGLLLVLALLALLRHLRVPRQVAAAG